MKTTIDKNGNILFSDGHYTAEEIRSIQFDAWERCHRTQGSLRLVDTASTIWATVKTNPYGPPDAEG